MVGSAVVAASVGTGSNVGAGRLGAYLQNADVFYLSEIAIVDAGSARRRRDGLDRRRLGRRHLRGIKTLATAYSERGLLSWCVQVELP